ncbi:MAG: AzlC family ABC transporter permease [Ruminococcus flavefaciens]|nr:AzlC family ABC transporter permease [Ruminococcus flavefaciens]MCM1361081.1 AzlC family ABC transporter permease [Clostridiales bacterium]MCM1434581.1 AzlC family ABC transporter permease [Ruminococcus flavefaciens]
MKSNFLRGMYHGIPIALGYLSVSFGFGIMAAKAGLSVLAASAISATNLTSAGQAAGVDIIAAGGTIIEMILVQLTINIRYSLMALSLSQKLDRKFTAPHRLAASYGITDEIFAVCSAQKQPLTPAYMYGMILVAFIGWVTGTALGAEAGQLLPAAVNSAMGIVLYGMFLAIIIPPSKKQKSVLAVVVAAAAVSILFKYVFTMVSGGFAVIISAVAASLVGAALFPVKDEEESVP